MYSYCSSVHPFLLRSVESSCGHLGTRRGTQSAGLRSIHQAYLGSAANETMNSVMEWLRPVMMSLLSAIEIYRNVMKWWWFILKPWVFPCRFTTPKKFPLTGDWGWAWKGEASASFWSSQDHSPEISAIWEATFGRWLCRWYVSNQLTATLIVSQQIVPIEAFHQRQHLFPPTPQIDDMVRVPVSFGTDPKYWRYFWQSVSRCPYLLCVQ